MVGRVAARSGWSPFEGKSFRGQDQGVVRAAEQQQEQQQQEQQRRCPTPGQSRTQGLACVVPGNPSL